ncbi:hypothetical protein GGI35DRAFT_123057 [Trichoderma velutinum]
MDRLLSFYVYDNNAATLSYYDGKSVGHTAPVALQSETDQPIQSLSVLLQRMEYYWEHSYLYQGLFGPQILERRHMVGRQCNPPTPHTKRKNTEIQPAKA